MDNYKTRLDLAAKKNPDKFKGRIAVTVGHQSGCGFDRDGLCDCSPDIVVNFGGERCYFVAADGLLIDIPDDNAAATLGVSAFQNSAMN